MADPISSAAKTAATRARNAVAKTTSSATSSVSAPSVAASGNANVTLSDNGAVSVTLPGLPVLTPDSIATTLTPFDPNLFRITDVNNIPDSLPQSTVDQHSQGIAKMEGALRHLELHQKSAQVSGKVFDVIGERASTIGKGLSAANKIEQSKNTYLDLLLTQESQKQKGVKLGLAQHRTAVDVQSAPFTKQGVMQDFERLKADTAVKQIEAEKAKSNLLKLQQELKGLIGRTVDATATAVQ